jgi:hypothetical protein
MMKAINRLTYDLSSELMGMLIGVPAGLFSAMYQLLFRP